MHLIALLLALAQGREGDRDETVVAGEIRKIEGRKLTLVIRKDGQPEAEQVVSVDDQAAVMLRDERAELRDLKPGYMVRMVVRGGEATRVVVTRAKEATERREGEREEKEGSTVQGEFARTEEGMLVLLIRKEGGRTAEQRLKLDKEAAILIEGEKGKLGDLKPGRPVRVLVRREIAVRVEVPRREGEREGERRREGERPAERPAERPVERPVEKPVERPFPVDETIVPKGDKPPDLGGRVLSVFEDGPLILVTVRQGGAEVPFYIPKDAAVAYVGLEKPDQKPTVGYLVYAWLKDGSKDTAGTVRFGRARY